MCTPNVSLEDILHQALYETRSLRLKHDPGIFWYFMHSQLANVS
jgi:hypothetical protein